MATQQILDIPTDAFIQTLIDRGILPAGTSRVAVWAGNPGDGTSHIKIIIANPLFADVDPVIPLPISTVDVAGAIRTLGTVV
jgi:hypothetical protein